VVTNCLRFGPRAYLVTLAAVLRLALVFRKRGTSLVALVRFLRSRHLRSQLILSGQADLVFFTSVPYTFSQRPWVVEIEDVTTLFCPFLRNGETGKDNLADALPYFPMVKALLESDNCKGIITHMQATARALPVLFQSEAIGRKTSYIPLGVEVPEEAASQEDDVYLNFLFTNSWHQDPASFYIRGGLDVLEAFAILQDRYPHLRLTLRTELPECLNDRYYRLIESCHVRVISRFLPSAQLDALIRQSQIYLLPAARVHAVSLLQAMAAGLVVVASDGWGFDEFIMHERNGLIVRGHRGKVSWQDPETGMLRENYEPMSASNPEVVQGLVDAVTRLIEDRNLRVRLGRQARADVQDGHSLEQWNGGLKAVLDRICRSEPEASAKTGYVFAGASDSEASVRS
jgi:glycosyltransferase involved in cell wall biosynthesis